MRVYADQPGLEGRVYLSSVGSSSPGVLGESMRPGGRCILIPRRLSRISDEDSVLKMCPLSTVKPLIFLHTFE